MKAPVPSTTIRLKPKISLSRKCGADDLAEGRGADPCNNCEALEGFMVAGEPSKEGITAGLTGSVGEGALLGVGVGVLLDEGVKPSGVSGENRLLGICQLSA